MDFSIEQQIENFGNKKQFEVNNNSKGFNNFNLVINKGDSQINEKDK